MRHDQYRDNIMERLRTWRMANPAGTIADAESELYPALSDDELRLLFKNWLINNLDRIEVTEISPGSLTASIRPHRSARCQTLEELAVARRKRDVFANMMLTAVKSNLYEDFAARIWDTVMPNGVTWRDATGKDFMQAGGIHIMIGKLLKPNEKAYKKLTTRQIFNLVQRAETS
jgi:hypothetical protein